MNNDLFHKPFDPDERWHVYEGGNFIKVVLDGYEEYVESEGYLGGPLAVAEMEIAHGEFHNGRLGPQLVRAQIAAAAPEMLKLLKTFVRAKGPSQPALDEARQLLARLEGREVL